MIRILSFMALIFVFIGTTNADAAKRVALVIGNSAYEHATPLANPKNDAADMTKKLEEIGFEVTSGLDLDLTSMRKTVRKFVNSLDGADMALFFYAGHGLQVNGSNYMAPIDAELSSYLDLDFETLPINLIMSAMEQSTKVNLVFLDACRDNPLARNLARSMGTRSGSVGRGLAKLGSGVGSLISFATQPGNVALDGNGRNSPFTTALLKHLGTPGQDVTRDLVYVRRDVLEQTNGKQVPWDNSSLTGEVILVPKKEEPTPEAKPNNDSQLEITFWNSIKDADVKELYEAYLQQYPNGSFAALAKVKITLIERRVAKEQEAIAAANAAAQQKAEEQRLAAIEAERVKQELEARNKVQQAEETARREAETAARLKAAEESRKAAEAARLAAEKRLVELEVAEKQRELEQARQKQELATTEEPSADQTEMEVALLEQPAAELEAEEVKIDPKKDRELVRSLQAELNRVGCSAGKADGIWGRKTSRAIDNYAKHGKAELASLDPSTELLDDIKKRKARICPLVCGRNQEEKNGRCVTIQKQASVPTKSTTRSQPKTEQKKATTTAPSTPQKRADGRICKVCSHSGRTVGPRRYCKTALEWARTRDPTETCS